MTHRVPLRGLVVLCCLLMAGTALAHTPAEEMALAAHNLLAKEITLADGSRAKESFSSEMQYNENGYPVAETSTRSDGSIDHFEYLYICK